MSWIANIDKHRISDLYIQRADGLHKAVDAYVMKSDGLHKWARDSYTFALLTRNLSLYREYVDGYSLEYATKIIIRTKSSIVGTKTISASTSSYPVYLSAYEDDDNNTIAVIDTPADFMIINRSITFPGRYMTQYGFPLFSYFRGDELTSLYYLFADNNGTLTDILGMELWDTSKVTDMSYLFYHTGVSSIGPLATWNVGAVTDMSYAFFYLTGLTSLQPLALWRPSSLTNARSMFQDSGITSLSGLEDWDTQNLQTAQDMFSETPITDTDALADWDTGNLQTMTHMFFNCPNLSDISAVMGWDVSHVTNASSCFWGCPITGAVTCPWDAASGANWEQLFAHTQIESVKFTGDLSGLADMDYMFSSCDYLEEVDFSGCDLSGMQYVNNAFSFCPSITDIYTPGVMPTAGFNLPATFTDGTTRSSELTDFPINTHIWRAS